MADSNNRPPPKRRSGLPAADLDWPELISGTLVRRYQRFLADVRLDSGRLVTAHCPNSGAMTACCTPRRPVYLSYHDSPKRKLKYTWELIDMPASLVGVNTMIPNRLVHRAAQAGRIPALSEYASVRREVAVGDHSRIDLMLDHSKRRPCYVEVKNCTLVIDGIARFPDAVTLRGRKHLVALERLVADGCRAVMFFLIQRMDAQRFTPADAIDAAYGRQLRHAVEAGVEILAYDVHIDLKSIGIRREIPCAL